MAAGKKSEANKYEGSLTDDEYKQYKAAEKSANLQKSNQFKADNGKRLEDLAKKVKALGNNRAEINKIENALSDEEFNLYDKYLQKQ
jgi:flagellar basal body P-ring protein FlgI